MFDLQSRVKLLEVYASAVKLVTQLKNVGGGMILLSAVVLAGDQL